MNYHFIVLYLKDQKYFFNIKCVCRYYCEILIRKIKPPNLFFAAFFRSYIFTKLISRIDQSRCGNACNPYINGTYLHSPRQVKDLGTLSRIKPREYIISKFSRRVFLCIFFIYRGWGPHKLASPLKKDRSFEPI